MRIHEPVLNVPVKGQEDLVRSIGGCNGSQVDKFEKFGIKICKPGWKKIDLEAAQDIKNIAVVDSCAQMVCRVQKVQDADKEHHLMTCQIDEAYVKK